MIGRGHSLQKTEHNDIIDSPSILKKDLLKIKSENARLKNNISSKDSEISILKSKISKIKQVGGFQMIKINSDNTHFDFDIKEKEDLLKSQTLGENNKRKSINDEMNKKLKEYNKFSIIKEESSPLNSVAKSIERKVEKKEVLSFSMNKYKESIPLIQSTSNFSRNQHVNNLKSLTNKVNSISLSKSVATNSFEDNKKIKYTFKKTVIPKIPKAQTIVFDNKEDMSNQSEIESLKNSLNNFNNYNIQNKIIFNEKDDYIHKLESENKILTKKNIQLNEKIQEINYLLSNNFKDMNKYKNEYEKKIKLLNNDLKISISYLVKIQKVVMKQNELIGQYKKEKEILESKAYLLLLFI